jgi:integrase
MAGQITKRGENTWYVRIFLGKDANGKRKHFNKTIHGTKKDAQKFLTAKLREKDLGTFIEPNSMALSEYLEKWLNEIAKPRLRESTFTQYVYMVKRYINKQLGSIKLSDLKAFQVQKLYGQLQEKALSPRTIRYCHNVLSSALKQAVKWQMINQNVCSLCELPKMQKTEMKCFTPTETTKFLQTARDDKFFVTFFLALETGCRPEEYLALQWKDIDFDNKALSVRRAINLKKGGGFVFAEPKTNRSRRSIPLSDSLLAELKKHRRKQLEEKMKLGQDYQNYDLVFASEIGTPYDIKNLRDRNFKKIIEKADLPKIRLYDLRHTTATLLLSAGENPKVVSERLGHASIVLTLDTYSHVLPTMQKEATNKLEKLMFGT